MEETIMNGPCELCGKTNYPLSFGGPMICPSCDCGDSRPVANAILRQHNLRMKRKLEAADAKLREIAEIARQTISADNDNDRLTLIYRIATGEKSE